ncbi:MAG: hypothetical protein O2874_03610 [Verrucomicrobia bacterium]|nr:hypothetical protein [Verrucomicrobiota bacterium]
MNGTPSASVVLSFVLAGSLGCLLQAKAPQSIKIVSSADWKEHAQEIDGLSVEGGTLHPTGKKGIYRSRLIPFSKKSSLRSITLSCSPRWDNWVATPKKVAPRALGDAPIFLVKGPKDYWLFGRYKGGNPKSNGFKPKKVNMEGYDMPLLSTPDPNLFTAPGGLEKDKGGYHAFQSRDMKNWVHHGSVTDRHAKWSTTAELVDGKAYIYYDFPNDQDPHLYIDDDLTDGKPGKDMGLAFLDPSDGSDCAIIRDLDGKFHLIYEDHSPINARSHSWDSPLAGHAVSDNGIGGFKILPPAVDYRTKPTGVFKEYSHPHWHAEHPKKFPAKEGTKQAYARYEVHEPEQDAYGDWGAIAIGGRYYLVGDFHPAHQSIRTAILTSPSLDQKFEFIGELGNGHPDPDIGFAEGQFYLINQTPKDYISPGPWVESAEVRVGVDTSKDGKADTWSEWAEVKEQYDHIAGFSKQIKRIPASMDLSKLPHGHGLSFEIRLTDTTENSSKPMIEQLEISFSK